MASTSLDSFKLPRRICLCSAGLIYLFLTFSAVHGGRNFYHILDVDREATSREIKLAYREKAKVMHPDRSEEPDANERFQDLTAAYEVLSDPDKRKIYDRSGEEGLAKMGDGHGFGHGHDVFSSFFGDFFGGGRQERDEETPRGADVVMDLYVTLEEVYKGNFVEVKRKKAVYKQTSGTRECNCRHEMKTQPLGAGRFQMFQVRVCDQCPNVMMTSQSKLLEVEVEIGADDGSEQRFVGEGEPHIEGDPGDLIFKIRVQKHKRFERRGLDLYTNVTISLQQALTGFEMEIEHLDGHKVHITRDKVTWPGARIRKRDEGMRSLTDNNAKGVLYVTFDIEFPKGELSQDQKAFLISVLKQDDFQIKVYNGLQGY